jgi:predicted HicB family RNase H-like nuclease
LKGEEQMEKKKSATSTINLRGIPQNLHHTLRVQAAIEKTSIKDLVVRILSEYLTEKSGYESPSRKEDTK